MPVWYFPSAARADERLAGLSHQLGPERDFSVQLCMLDVVAPKVCRAPVGRFMCSATADRNNMVDGCAGRVRAPDVSADLTGGLGAVRYLAGPVVALVDLLAGHAVPGFCELVGALPLTHVEFGAALALLHLPGPKAGHLAKPVFAGIFPGYMPWVKQIPASFARAEPALAAAVLTDWVFSRGAAAIQ